jgi:hypothetical protein
MIATSSTCAGSSECQDPVNTRVATVLGLVNPLWKAS